MTQQSTRPLALITGGCGGMGIACAREFGKSHDLLLADIAVDRLADIRARLEEEGYRVAACVVGDLADGETVPRLMEEVDHHGKLGVLVHTAGISSGLADWRTILRTNVLGTRYLLDAIETRLRPGAVGILISSIAGHLAARDQALDALLASAVSDEFLDVVEPYLADITAAAAQDEFALTYSDYGGAAYGLSKRNVNRLTALRCGIWAEQGARIVSISPGIIWTPMGRYEVEHGEAAGKVLADTALARWGTPMDIAQAAAFLASDKASFITGTDLRIDGGAVPIRLGDSY